MALCALTQLFIVVTHPPLIRLLTRETLGYTKTRHMTHRGDGVSTGEGTGSARPSLPPLLALLQGEREELCLGALLVLQVGSKLFLVLVVVLVIDFFLFYFSTFVVWRVYVQHVYNTWL